MVKYTLLHKPTLSGWPTIPRQIKTIFIAAVFITLTFLIITQSRKNAQLAELYNLQVSVMEILDLELKYMPSDPLGNETVWRPTAIPEGNILSAYLDIRPEIVLENRHKNSSKEKTWAEIRIIAVLPLELDHGSVNCYYKYKDRGSGKNIQKRASVSVTAIEENWGLKYSAFFVLCDLSFPRNRDFKAFYYEDHLPVGVNIGPADDELENTAVLQFVPISYPRNGIATAYNPDKFLSVCIPVFHHEYDRALHLVEFIEYHLMLGAEHFTFYNQSITEEVSQVMQHYADKGVATVIRWELPSYYVYEQTLRVSGIFAALNDCLYRSSFYDSYKYVLGIDVDEFILPRKHNDFRELMDELDPVRRNGVRGRHASFVFRNVFFYTMYEDDTTYRSDSGADVPYLYTQAKTQRVREVNAARFRSKYIVRGQDVVELGNHNVWKNRPGSSIFSERFDELAVDPEVATSNHYRDCEGDQLKCYLKATVTDTAAHKYADELGPRVRAACKKIFKDAGCPPPTD